MDNFWQERLILVLMWREINEDNLKCRHLMAAKRNRWVPHLILREAYIDMADYEIRAGA
ncbi:hypothetical protein ACQ4WY_06890 [Janthinobacterium sp. LB2P49]|uniref:hypothetical protein n=1 Tax=Janthinobacterium sp. LB2P49 TaxID=3424198 RepID=UPI003F228442